MMRPRNMHHVAAFAAIVALPIALGACDIIVTNGTYCVIEGEPYMLGETFLSPDGCNTCTCMEDGNAVCTAMVCITPCVFSDAEHVPGETFPAGDGCNTCSCLDGGVVACTEMSCPVACEYHGAVYSPGDSFPAFDGCNTCSCGPTGDIGCTDMACECHPSEEWWRHYVSTNPNACALALYTCPPNTTGFENACGCGCEQAPSCPEWFDCMPPAPCDLQAIHEACPYSGIAF